MHAAPWPYLTFSCQGSFRATADGSSGSLLKAVGVCASCSESRRLQDGAGKQRNPRARGARFDGKHHPHRHPEPESSTSQSSRVQPRLEQNANQGHVLPLASGKGAGTGAQPQGLNEESRVRAVWEELQPGSQ